MIQTEKYSIAKSGLIDSGWVTYTLNTDTGIINYAGDVKAGPFSIIDETIPAGEYTVDPSCLISATLSKVGTTLPIGPALFTITEVDQNMANCKFLVAGENQVEGTAVLDLSSQYVKVLSVNATAILKGHNLNLILTRE